MVGEKWGEASNQLDAYWVRVDFNTGGWKAEFTASTVIRALHPWIGSLTKPMACMKADQAALPRLRRVGCKSFIRVRFRK
ncbi:protein of unknown function [Candidatus Nitrotoga arctica]|uniref:Uncharacterized protein n=1 Tax=Candidatus Nitrotoga arctica TaxID=453162 RepID=A0ABN8AIA3_9PROT|nr:protein of unknown function [Candidatus Nitrotoga arctica]